MNPLFKDIKVIAWDLDTTLYRAIPELSFVFKKECIKEVANNQKITLKKASQVFEDMRARLGSSTLTLATLKIGDQDLIEQIQDRINKVKYIKTDPKLKILFAKLSKFRHFVITNGKRKNSLATLSALGLSLDIFEQIITVEDTNKPKPDPAAFELLVRITGLPPENHLMVGDMEKVDIEPAKKLGFKTILVWGQSFLADASLSSVYEVADLLL